MHDQLVSSLKIHFHRRFSIRLLGTNIIYVNSSWTFTLLPPYPNLSLYHENLCRPIWYLSHEEGSMFLIRKAATISEALSICDNLDSSTDVTTPEPFQEHCNPTPHRYPKKWQSREPYRSRNSPSIHKGGERNDGSRVAGDSPVSLTITGTISRQPSDTWSFPHH